MRVSAGKLRPSILVAMTVLAGSAALAFETGGASRETAPDFAFPSFIGEQQFLELFAAHKALASRAANVAPPPGGVASGIVAAAPADGGVRERAEELSQRFFKPADEPRETAASDVPGARNETQADRDALAAGAAGEATPRAALEPPPPAEAKREPPPPAAGAASLPAPSKVGAVAPDRVSQKVLPAAAAPAPRTVDRARKSAKAPPAAATAKSPPVPAPARRVAARPDAYVPAPPARGSADGRNVNPPAAAPSKSVFSSVHARNMPTELQVFGWD